MNKTPWFRTFSYRLSSNKVTHVVKYQSRIGAFLKNNNKKKQLQNNGAGVKPVTHLRVLGWRTFCLKKKKKKMDRKNGKKAFEGVQTVSAAVIAAHWCSFEGKLDLLGVKVRHTQLSAHQMIPSQKKKWNMTLILLPLPGECPTRQSAVLLLMC